jgi:hypothetical protein
LGDGDDIAWSSIIGDRRQRRILSLLLDRDHPMTERELGVRLATLEDGVEPSDVTESTLDSIRIDLHHRCLPQQTAVGWIERRPDGVVIDERPSFESAKLSPPDLRAPEDPTWDAVSVLLARPYRQDIASLLVDRHRDTALTELTTELRGRRPPTHPDDDRALRVSLHHVDLPTLADAELVAYDPAERTVTPAPRLTAFADRVALDSR